MSVKAKASKLARFLWVLRGYFPVEESFNRARQYFTIELV
jgi:hypothetical protein